MSDFTQFLSWESTTQDTIDFKMAYVDMAEDLLAGLVLSHIVYWYLPSKDGRPHKMRVFKNGYHWIARQREAWYDDIRITPKQVDRALGILVDKGIIIKEYYKFDGERTTHIRINPEGFMKAWERVITNRVEDRSLPKGNPDSDESLRPLTETTTETTTNTPIQQQSNNGNTLPIALDGHQRAIDQASGGISEDPSDEAGQHLYWGFMEGPVPIPRGKKEWGKWHEAGCRLLSRLPQPWDLRVVSQRIDEWFVDEELDDFWKRMPCKDEALDLIAKYIVQAKGEPQPAIVTAWRWKDEPVAASLEHAKS